MAVIVWLDRASGTDPALARGSQRAILQLPLLSSGYLLPLAAAAQPHGEASQRMDCGRLEPRRGALRAPHVHSTRTAGTAGTDPKLVKKSTSSPRLPAPPAKRPHASSPKRAQK